MQLEQVCGARADKYDESVKQKVTFIVCGVQVNANFSAKAPGIEERVKQILANSYSTRQAK